LKQHHFTAERRKNLHRLYFYIKKYKDKYPLTQICSLFGFDNGTSPATLAQYRQQLLDSGIIKVNGDRVVSVVEIEAAEE